MGRKLWEKEKLLVTSNFSFSHSVFKRFVSQGRQKVSLCGNGLIYFFFFLLFFLQQASPVVNSCFFVCVLILLFLMCFFGGSSTRFTRLLHSFPSVFTFYFLYSVIICFFSFWFYFFLYFI